MKKLIILLSLTLSTLCFANEAANLRYLPEFIFSKVLEMKNLEKNNKIAFPKIYFQSKTPLKQFQDALEKQWGFRPEIFTNAFAVENNEIYILDDADYYKKQERCMDDSLAHELTHYVQVKYLNWDLSDESLEWDAVEIQTEFRKNYCSK